MDWKLEEEIGSSYSLGATLLALFLILLFSTARALLLLFSPRRYLPPPSPAPQFGILQGERDEEEEIVSASDLKFLIKNLEDNEKHSRWEHVIHKHNNLVSYSAQCSKSKDAAIKYLSVAVFENCAPEILRDFYMDNEYRMQWDNTLLLHHQLHLRPTHATEIGRTVKKFPLLAPREYVLAWRLWRAAPHTFYCFIKECEHPLAPLHKKYVRVRFFRSGWRISKVPGTNACEIKMYHQEDAGLHVEVAKLAFSRGIWSYVCKMDRALRNYMMITRPQIAPAFSALSLMQKVPLELEIRNNTVDAPAVTPMDGAVNDEAKEKKLNRRPSRKALANGLLLLGGVICLSRGPSSLGARVVMAYILTKLRKRDASAGQSRES